jgi:lysyl-tRNA synthetase class 2
MQWGSARGVRQASLNFAAFRPLFDAEQRRPVEALGYRTVHLLDRWIKLESLYQFNAKFRPSWVPRSVVLRSWSDLPFVLPAALTAEFGGSLDFRRPSTAALRAQADADAAGVGPPLPADGLANPPLANP